MEFRNHALCRQPTPVSVSLPAAARWQLAGANPVRWNHKAKAAHARALFRLRLKHSRQRPPPSSQSRLAAQSWPKLARLTRLAPLDERSIRSARLAQIFEPSERLHNRSSMNRLKFGQLSPREPRPRCGDRLRSGARSCQADDGSAASERRPLKHSHVGARRRSAATSSPSA